MANVRGAVVIPTPADAGRQHRQRIRQLSANPSGFHGADTPWFTIGAAGQPAFQTNWGSALGLDPNMPPVQYMRDRMDIGHLRGTLIYGNTGWNDYSGLFSHIPPQIIPVAFTLPVGFRPAVGNYFHAVDTSGSLQGGTIRPSGSGVGHVAVGFNGDVSPMVQPTGLGSTSVVFVADVFDSLGDGLALQTAAWRNATGNVYGYKLKLSDSSTGFGIVSGGDIPDPFPPGGGSNPLPPCALYLGTGPYGDCSIKVDVNQASFIMLGVHLQATQFDPTTMAYPAGYWLGYHVNFGFFYVYYSDGRGIYPIVGPVAALPLFDGAQLMFSVNNFHAQVTTFPGGTLSTSLTGLAPQIFGSGLFGMGASGSSAAHTKLLSRLTLSMSEFTSINLDGVRFSTV